MEYLKYSVLMSVYYKENPDYLRQSIDSMLNQTFKPDEIVIVRDGKVTKELEVVINEYKSNKIIRFIELDENVGLGIALNIGLKKCKNELIARMDTDDISRLDRCEKQINMFKEDESLSIVGSAIAEFENKYDNVKSYKEVLEKHEDIKKYMKFRNPMNHPTVMYKKQSVLEVGNYEDFLYNEDYYLWFKMMINGMKFRNINEPLVFMRVSNETYKRRGGMKYFIAQKKLFDEMYKKELINLYQYIYNLSTNFIFRVLISDKIRSVIYYRILRKDNI